MKRLVRKVEITVTAFSVIMALQYAPCPAIELVPRAPLTIDHHPIQEANSASFIVVKFSDFALARSNSEGRLYFLGDGSEALDIQAISSRFDLSFEPILLGLEDEVYRIQSRAEQLTSMEQPDLLGIFRVSSPILSISDLPVLVDAFESSSIVEYAHLRLRLLESPSCDPITCSYPPPLQEDVGECTTYFHTNPGVGVDYIWQLGGTGAGVRISDLEYLIDPQHPDIAGAFSIEDGFDLSDLCNGDHGTHSVGVLGAIEGDSYGITGASHDSDICFYPIRTNPNCGESAEPRLEAALTKAAADSDFGDVILIETTWFIEGADGQIPVESDATIALLIATITNSGVIVIEPAGNGNPFTWGENDVGSYLHYSDSGAIMVGAGMADLQHEYWVNLHNGYGCNYGYRVDVQSWGVAVFSPGDGLEAGCQCLQGNCGIDVPLGGHPYTSVFGATSGASAIVAGAVGALQSYAKQHCSSLSPWEMKNLLANTGWYQGLSSSGTRPIGQALDLESAAISLDSGWLDIANRSFPRFNETAGSAWGDFDNDGDEDILVSGIDTETVLVKNIGGQYFSPLQSLTGQNPFSGSLEGRGCAWVDYDNDGDLDLFQTNSAGNSTKLFSNVGGAVLFTDVAPLLEIDDNDEGRTVSCADFNRNGYVDVFVANHGGNRFYTNWAGSLSDSSSYYGLVGGGGVDSEGSEWCDFDDDGRLDLFVANGTAGNYLYHSLSNGIGFEEVGSESDTDVDLEGVNSICGTWGDFDVDGDSDLLIVNATGAALRLYENDGAGGLIEVPSAFSGGDLLSSGATWLDLDNDRDLDIVVTNWSPSILPEKTTIYQNNAGVFTPWGESLLKGHSGGWTVSTADFDENGAIDFCITSKETGGQVVLESGVGCADRGNWIELKMEGDGIGTNRAAIGASATVFLGGVGQKSTVSGGGGFLSQRSMVLHFGLGDATIVDSVVVRWPNEAMLSTAYDSLQVNTKYYISQTAGVSFLESPAHEIPAFVREIQAHPNPFNPRVELSIYLDKQGFVKGAIYDVSGRVVHQFSSSVSNTEHSFEWNGFTDDGKRCSSGVYFAKASSGGSSKCKKLVLLK
jgi:hypothetical protein